MRVVHCKKEAHTHYIGRGPKSIGLHNRYVWTPSKLAYTVQVSNRDDSLRYFEQDTRRNPKMMAQITALPEDAVLGCWCHPKPCHGDVIVKLWKEIHEKSQ